MTSSEGYGDCQTLLYVTWRAWKPSEGMKIIPVEEIERIERSGYATSVTALRTARHFVCHLFEERAITGGSNHHDGTT